MGVAQYAESSVVKIDSIFADLGKDRKKKRPGEVFTFCVKPSRWFLGQITTTDGSVGIFKNIIVANFFGKEFASEPTMSDFYQLTVETKSLIPPQLMNATGWRDGQFRTIGVAEVLQPLDVTPHAFYDPFSKLYKDEFENVVLNPPVLKGFRGLGNVYVVSDKIEDVLRS
jgi:hypothetical protein